MTDEQIVMLMAAILLGGTPYPTAANNSDIDTAVEVAERIGARVKLGYSISGEKS